MAQLGPIKPGDIVELNIKGRQFYAKVTEAAHGSPSRITINPSTVNGSRITYAHAKAAEVIGHYRKTKNVRQVSVPMDMTPTAVQH